MSDAGIPRDLGEGGGEPLAYPANRVIGAIDRSALAAVVPELIDAGFAPVGILAGEAGLRRIAATSGEGGIGGMLRRAAKSTGGDLDQLRRAEQDLRSGRALVDVEVAEDGEVDLARDVFRRHGATSVTHLQRWTIKELI